MKYDISYDWLDDKLEGDILMTFLGCIITLDHLDWMRLRIMTHNASHAGSFVPQEFGDNGQHTASHYGLSMQHEVEDNEGHNAQYLGLSMQMIWVVV